MYKRYVDKMSSYKEIKLYYFNITGRAEHIRYLFGVGGVKYEDRRVSKAEWPDLKPKTPLGGMPVLELDGEMVGQSLATGRLAAKIAGLYGSNEVEQGKVDSLVDTINDIRETGFGIFYTPAGEEKDKKVKEFRQKKVPGAFAYLIKFLNGKDYLVNNKLSWADIHFYAVVEVLEEIGNSGLLTDFPELAALYKRVGELPGVQETQKRRPERTDFK